jgi:hypothetical protein
VPGFDVRNKHLAARKRCCLVEAANGAIAEEQNGEAVVAPKCGRGRRALHQRILQNVVVEVAIVEDAHAPTASIVRVVGGGKATCKRSIIRSDAARVEDGSKGIPAGDVEHTVAKAGDDRA